MAIRESVNPDTGQPHFDVDGHAVITGPVRGVVETSDGTQYDVTPAVIEVPVDVEHHVGELDHIIGVMHEQAGHPTAEPRGSARYNPLRDEYVHVCRDHCGPHKRTPKEAEQQFAARLDRLGHGDLVGTTQHVEVVRQIHAAHKALSSGTAYNMSTPDLGD